MIGQLHGVKIVTTQNPDELDIRYNAIEGVQDLMMLRHEALGHHRNLKTLVLTKEQLETIMQDMVDPSPVPTKLFGMKVAISPRGNLF
jgi:hypothetical protein